MKTKTRKKNNNVTEGSGNVFADMGVAEPEQALAKAKLAAKIAIAIEQEQLLQSPPRRCRPPTSGTVRRGAQGSP